MKNCLWNMFISIKNGQIVKKPYILQQKTKINIAFLNILWNEGFILGFNLLEKNSQLLKIYLKYKEGKPVINSLQFISKPGHRLYYTVKQLWKIDSSKGIVIVSTNKGFLTLGECKKRNIGGEPFVIIN